MIWKPDTCRCALEYAGSNIPDNIVRTVRVCPDHGGLSGKELATAILAENQSKNLVHSELLKDATLTHTRLTDDGQSVVEFAAGVEYVWQFTGSDAARTLQVAVVGARILSPAAKTSLRATAASFPLTRIEVL